jgi:predicted Zn-ribbon and HTH transcriptional regulator
MQVLTIQQCVCLKCGHDWIPRKPGRPTLCPRCGNAKWYEAPEKKRKVAAR